LKLFLSNSGIAAKSLSVFFSFLLWLNVTTNETYDLKVYVPIKYTENPQNLVLTSRIPDEAVIIVTGSGKRLLVFYLSKMFGNESNLVFLNFSGIQEGRNKVEIENSSVILSEKTLRIKEILFPENGSFPIFAERKIKRTVPVFVDSLSGFTVSDKFFLLSKPVIDPSTVTIEGPESIIKSITSIPVKSLREETVKIKNDDLPALIRTPEFINSYPNSVNVHFSLEEIISVDFKDIPLNLKHFPKKNAPEPRNSTINISLKGPRSIIEKIERKKVSATINYKDYIKNHENGIESITPVIKYPAGVLEVSLDPGEIKFETND